MTKGYVQVLDCPKFVLSDSPYVGDFTARKDAVEREGRRRCRLNSQETITHLVLLRTRLRQMQRRDD